MAIRLWPNKAIHVAKAGVDRSNLNWNRLSALIGVLTPGTQNTVTILVSIA